MAPVRRAHLADARAGRFEQIRQPESVADLDQLAAADDDLAARGQGGGRQHQRGGVVIDHMHGLRPRHGAGQRGEHAAAAASPLAGRQVVLKIGIARGGLNRCGRRSGQGRPAEVGVQQDAGGVDDPGEAVGPGRQRRDRGVGDLGRRQVS
jgi:hypothetical protein